jgi:aminoglycoside phosphotransferase (APT) family kinase protein
LVTGTTRGDQVVTTGFLAWLADRTPGGSGFELTECRRPSDGYSNETFLVAATWTRAGQPESLQAVLRLPPLLPSFPVYDLRMQAEVHRVVAANGIPAPAVIAVEDDPAWLEGPFLLMERVAGRVPGETIVLDPFVLEADESVQARLQRDFLEVLARLHTLDWSGAGLGTVVPGAGRTLADEVRWWADYLRWDLDGDPSPGLLEAVSWCLDTVPGDVAPQSLLWGDPRYGNVMCDPDRRVTAVLDFELATFGPAEMDLAWNLALDGMSSRWLRRTVPGFLPHDAIVDCYQRMLGRELRDLPWHEIFALVRSASISQRQARLAARVGAPYPGPAAGDNPMVTYILRRIERLGG